MGKILLFIFGFFAAPQQTGELSAALRSQTEALAAELHSRTEALSALCSQMEALAEQVLVAPRKAESAFRRRAARVKAALLPNPIANAALYRPFPKFYGASPPDEDAESFWRRHRLCNSKVSAGYDTLSQDRATTG